MKELDIRAEFKKYFNSLNHKWYSSSSLIPEDDPTMLFTTAGMVQFKKYFLDDDVKLKRAASIQKCLRTSDIDEVGKTTMHLTFFEMFGNFSFGDYGKDEAIKWAWEFLTDILEISDKNLVATVFKDDKEAYEIWRKYLTDEKIFCLDEENNFWKMGDTGPCGPCSEILYDTGADNGCLKPGCGVECNCARYIEVWNLVFTQFDRSSDGSLKPLPKKNIDTGMGLERLYQIFYNLKNVYEIPFLKPLMDKIKTEASHYNETSARIIADHSRAVTFLIADGVFPSNEGSGYVLRKIIRRAVTELNKLGWKTPKLWQYTAKTVDIMSEFYPLLLQRATHIANVCKLEEESFLITLDKALWTLKKYIKEMKGKELSADKVFKLYDTYGLPVDITKSVLSEYGFSIDEKEFNLLLKKHSEQAGWREKETSTSYYNEIKNLRPTEFTGYNEYETEAKVIKILDFKKAIIINKTPFYAQSGGQVGDKGVINTAGGTFQVKNTLREEGVIIHEGEMKGDIKEGDTIKGTVNINERKAIERNHTATHLLQSALREFLGNHIQQNGSHVFAEGFRFDYTHTKPLTVKQLEDIEKFVNNAVMDNIKIAVKVMSMKEAQKSGALAFFEEKYSDEVRTIIIEAADGRKVSMELCGGTHIKATGEIGLFKIVSETGIARGVRRIEAVTGNGAIKFIREKENILMKAAVLLNVPEEKIEDKLNKLFSQTKELQEKIDKLENRIASGSAEGEVCENIGNIVFIKRDFGDVSNKLMRNWLDKQVNDVNKVSLAVGVLGGRVTLILKISENLTKILNAKKIMIEAASELGGGGGGRKNMAQGGGNNLAGIKKAEEIIKKYLQPLRRP